MKHEISFNEQWINGFIEAMLAQLEEDLGPFKSDLHDYAIMISKEEEQYKIIIPYAIIGDSRADLQTYFFLTKQSQIKAFRLKVEICVEEIIAHIKSFRNAS